MTLGVLLLTAASIPQIAGTPAPDLNHRRWSLGVQVGALDLPSGHLGIPEGTNEDDPHIAAAFVGRYQIGENSAIVAGFGLPSSAMGPSLWGGFELLARLWTAPRSIIAVELYEASGLQLGFAGPDYYVRHDNEFVGYGYAFGGPPSVALRLPVGLRLCWLRNRFDTYLEGVEILSFAPSVESLFTLAGGVRVHW